MGDEMKSTLLFKCSLFLMLLFFNTLFAAFYVAPDGDDKNAGTITEAWGTWQKAFDMAQAGDTVWFRGGTWYPDDGQIVVARLNPEQGHGHIGTPQKPIVFINYPNEVPILDCSKNRPDSRSCGAVYVKKTAYVELHGLTVQNVTSWPNSTGELYTQDFIISDNLSVTLKNCTARRGGGVGFWVSNNDTVHLINCDSYDRCDSLDFSDPGGDADGFIISGGDPNNKKVVFMSGCRAWGCSDDGIDLTTYYQYYLSNNWSFDNGNQDAPYYGDGTGIKVSGSVVRDVSKRVMRHNLTAFNRRSGIAELNLYSPAAPWMQLYNNTSYKDYAGYSSGLSGGNWNFSVDSGKVVSANNLIYKPTHKLVGYTKYNTYLTAYDPPTDYITSTTDSWIFSNSHWYNRDNPAFSITDADFVSVDSATIISQLTAPRKADGSLPDFTALTLAPTSDLIDGGTAVGYPFKGNAPDLGAFEYSPSTHNKIPQKIKEIPQKTFTIGESSEGRLILNFTVSHNSSVQFSLFDLQGRYISQLLDKQMESGHHTINLPALSTNLATGIYLCQMHIDGQSIVKSVILR